MRLTSMTLQRYGNYAAERILFDPAPGVVNILLAPNSAGKSVLRNAFADLLFGIHPQTPMDFRFGYAGMSITADIVAPDGAAAAFTRRKTRANVVTGPNEQPLDPGFLHRILAGRDRKLLERLFVLDTEGLRAGGADLLASGGDVASALLAAAGGIRQARGLKADLERKRDELAPLKRTASRPFYQSLDRFLEARRRASAETLKPDVWFRQQQELDDLDQRRRTLNEAADAASAEIARLERIRRVRRWLVQRSNAIEWLEAHPEALLLSAETRRALEAARLDIATKQETERLARETFEDLTRNAEDVVVDVDLMACAAQIKQLIDAAGGARTARADLPGRHAELELSLARQRDLLRQLGSALPPERAAEALPTRALMTRTRQRIKEHAELLAAVATARTQTAARTNDFAELERRLAELPVPPDLRNIEALLDEIRSDGDPAARLAEADTALAESDAALAASLARVPNRAGDADALAALSPPDIDVWRRLDTDMSAKRGEALAAETRLEDDIARRRQSKGELDALSREGTVLDNAALARARDHRYQGWQLIYRRAFTADPPTAAEEQAFTAGAPLPLAFERAIADADAIADRRAADSELLGRIDAARQAFEASTEQMHVTEEQLRLANEAFAQARRAWSQLCGSIGQNPDAALSDIQTFLNARLRVIDAMQRRATAKHACTSLRERQQCWTDALGAALGVAPSSLPTLLGLADRTLAEAKRQHQERSETLALHTRAAKELRDSTAGQATAIARLDAWRKPWREHLVELGRPEAEEPAETEAVLQIFNDIEKELPNTTSLSERIVGMNAVIDRFASSVRELRLTLPGHTSADDPFEAVRELDRKLEIERARDERRRTLRDGLAKAKEEFDAAAHALTAAQATLQAVLGVIGAESIETATERLALADQRAMHEARRVEAETELRQAGDGRAIEELQAETAQIEPEEDIPRIEAARMARKEASDAAQRAVEDSSRLRQHLEQLGNETKVNEAAADQQAAIASLSRALDEALLYHTASLLLSRALDEVEQSGGSAMLRRLSAIFQALTNGLYANVTSEPGDNDKAELVLIQRDFPEERQHIDQLSEGTRDQLFLALRVAAIEDHLTGAEALPFIGDDILQTFDDERALAALRVLAGLSRDHTQVIVLTHHRHVLDLAAHLPIGTIFPCQREPLVTTT
jgi:uncharacterized protein YhaN